MSLNDYICSDNGKRIPIDCGAAGPNSNIGPIATKKDSEIGASILRIKDALDNTEAIWRDLTVALNPILESGPVKMEVENEASPKGSTSPLGVELDQIETTINSMNRRITSILKSIRL